MRSLLAGRARWLLLVGALVIALGSTLAAAVGISVQRPAPLLSVASGMKRLDLRGLPPIRRFAARDGEMLAYRAYPGASEEVAILIHGSAGQSPLMHAMTQSIQHTGATVYTLDIRGHGESGRRGDIDYVGQLDDDLADFGAPFGRRIRTPSLHLQVFRLEAHSRCASRAGVTAACSIVISRSRRRWLFRRALRGRAAAVGWTCLCDGSLD